MKSERAITLISIIIYVILMTFVVAGISAITTTFYTNVNDIDKDSESAVSFSKFNMYFINDIKSENAKVIDFTSTSIALSFKGNNGTQQTVTYKAQGDGLYREKVKIFDKLKDIKIEADKTTGIITIYLKINNYEKTTTYQIEKKLVIDSSTII